MTFLAAHGLAGLFVAAFLAATVLPFSSEVLLGLLLTQGMDPVPVLFWATAGNLLGSVTNYGIGLWGSRFVLEKVLRMDPDQVETACGRFQRWGTLSLLLAWVPVVGDPLTVAAGILKTRFSLFLVLVGTGKFLRYLFITWALVWS